MCAVFMMTLAISALAMAAGTVEEVSFYSDALGMEKNFQIYLPEGYETSGLSYPTVYYIHGMTSSYLGHQNVIDAAEDMISRGLIQPFILVKPDADCFPFADAGFTEPIHSSMTNSELNGDFEDYFVEDLVSRIDADYRTMADRDHRFAAGHSQGGYSAVRAGLRHPDLFSAVGAHASPLSFEPLAQLAPFMVLQDYPDGPPYDYQPDTGFVSKILFAFAAAFTPNLSNPPWFVDLPFDEYGQPDPVVFPRLVSQSTTRWAAEFKASGAELDIYFEVGTQEELAADYLSQYFAAVLDTLELPYTFRWFDGDHHSHVGIRAPNQFTFFMPLNATLELSPRIINGRNWWPLVEASLELPGDLDVAAIDTATLAITQINGEDIEQPLRALVASEITDLNGNGRDDLTIWFWKPSLLRLLADLGIADHETFDVTVEGETVEGWSLAATDSQRAVNLPAAAAMPNWFPWPLGID
jgi:pimeloyl-ACP methyl ester carboxylesterase